MSYLDELNESQRDAVITTDGPLMVIAGAGSGKTRVITYRIAYLIENICAPKNILAVTFTNKAAKEMKERALKIVGDGASEVTLLTFHSFCHKVLRKYAYLLGLKNSFEILDEDDSKKYIKDALDALNLDSKVYQPKMLKYYFSKIKNNEKIDYILDGDLLDKVKLIYDKYQSLLKADNALDFDDLIYFTVLLFRTQPDILEFYQNLYRYIMVDEFQDTNAIQYELVYLLSSKYQNICIVGDQDQSIYSFRGAKVENINRFKDDFKDAKLVKLELNYRSSENILNVANNLISNNITRIKKELKPTVKEEHDIVYKRLNSSYEEAIYILDKIEYLIRKENKTFSDFCVLYRNNALSRNIEDVFIRNQIPYIVYGGVSFFDRMEIKDLIAYLRLIVSPDSDYSLKRIINVPKRKLGKVTINKLNDFAKDNSISMFEAIDSINFGQSIKNSLLQFKNIILELQNDIEGVSPKSFIDMVIKKTGYEDYLKETYEDFEERLDNINEFKSIIFEAKDLNEGIITNKQLFLSLLEDLKLKTDNDLKVINENCVVLSTIHQAKGLEFDTVFMIGMEHGIFPSFQSFSNPRDLEEERRICYVALTRCKRNLFLTNCYTRLIYGENTGYVESSFIKEMNLSGQKKKKEETSKIKINNGNSYYHNSNNNQKADFKPGDKIRHKMFEDGVVIKVDNDLITVAFKHPHGIKTLMKNHPSISKL